MRKNIVIGSPKGRFLRFFFDEFAIQIQTSIIHLKFNLSRSVHNDSRTFMNLSPTFLKLSPTFLGKSPTFFGKRPMFLLDAWRRMILTSEKHFWCSQSSSFPPLTRVRVRARDTSIHIFHKRKHFIFHLPFLPSRSLRQKVREKVRQKRNYLGRFSKNVGDFSKNVGDFSKNIGDLRRSLCRYLYPIQHIPRSASIFRLHGRALLLLQAMVPLQNWACFAFGQRLLRCRTGAFIISPRA